jgi:hypothetical protein
MNSLRILACAGLVILSTGLAAGCSSEKTVDAQNAADTIQKQYPDESGGLTMTSISCGEGKAEVDATFTCTAENDGGVSLDIEATVTDVPEDSDKVNFTWSVVASTSDGTAYAEAAVRQLQAQGYAVASMDCPEVEIKSGNKVECDVTMDNGSAQTATVTLTDDNGGFNVVTSGPASG